MARPLAKVYARTFSYSGSATQTAGALKIVVEWRLLCAPFESGELPVTIDRITTDNQLTEDLRSALCAYLSSQYSPAVFQAQDVVGYSA